MPNYAGGTFWIPVLCGVLVFAGAITGWAPARGKSPNQRKWYWLLGAAVGLLEFFTLLVAIMIECGT